MHPPATAAAIVAAFTLALPLLGSPASAAPRQTPAQDTARAPSPPARGSAAPADRPVYTIAPVEVVGSRRRGYAARASATAMKAELPLRDTPHTVSVVTRDAIADQSMQTMADVVRYVPGVTMGQGEGHRDAPVLRGNASTADFYVDGMRDDAQYFRDLYNVERVEALKGPNGMIFGRGGGGGVINRVSKEAEWSTSQAFTLEGGSFRHRRGTLDVGRGVGPLALRLNGMLEDSRGFRAWSSLQRAAVNPTLALALGARTVVRAGYEYFRDDRTVDRGIPSFEGRPSPAPLTTFFGNPDSSYARARVQAATTFLEHVAGAVTIRNRSRFTDYDKFYQNSYPGAVNAAGTQVSLAAYNHATPRRNLLNQTDVLARLASHALLAGLELGRQRTDNYRETGYYDGTATSLPVDFGRPTVSAPIAFRQSATDADNRTVARVVGLYVQDYLTVSGRWQAIAGLRHDRFDLRNRNHRTGEELRRRDRLFSPRLGLVYKPAASGSVYASYTVSFLPGSGDQFSSLTATSATLEPERFTNVELGAKWDLRSGLSLTAAAYRLDRTNTTAPDPGDPKRIVQTGSQRSTGLEAGLAGDLTADWHVIAGLGVQRARVLSATSAAQAGATVALVPARSLSLWNRYDLSPRIGAGLGLLHQSGMFAAVDNAVSLPGFTRLDGALFLRVHERVSARLNVENLFGARYYPTSQGNNNILPGAGRSLRLALLARP